MGCCQSRDHTEANDRVNGAGPHPANRPLVAIDGPPRSLSDADSAHNAAQNGQPADATSEPLRPPTPLANTPANLLQTPPPWTRGELESQREQFFETRLTGNSEAWSAIRLVCELLRQSPPDVAEAQAVLVAADLKCVHGRIASSRGRNRRHGGVYDQGGILYSVPPWVVTDPQDTIEEGAEKDEADTSAGAIDDSDDEDLKAPRSPREEKGKGRAESPGRVLQIKCRRSDRSKDHFIAYNEKQPAETLLISLQDKVGEGKEVRLMLGGKRLDLSKTLAQQGWADNKVLNAFVADVQPAE